MIQAFKMNKKPHFFFIIIFFAGSCETIVIFEVYMRWLMEKYLLLKCAFDMRLTHMYTCVSYILRNLGI